MLADIMPFCKIVVNRFNDATLSNMIQLVDAATGHALSVKNIHETVQNILQIESRLRTAEGASEGLLNKSLKMEEYENEPTINRTTA